MQSMNRSMIIGVQKTPKQKKNSKVFENKQTNLKIIKPVAKAISTQSILGKSKIEGMTSNCITLKIENVEEDSKENTSEFEPFQDNNRGSTVSF